MNGPTLTREEKVLLFLCARCPECKGFGPISKDGMKIANKLVKKGLAWTMDGGIVVCLATDEGRKWIDDHVWEMVEEGILNTQKKDEDGAQSPG